MKLPLFGLAIFLILGIFTATLDKYLPMEYTNNTSFPNRPVTTVVPMGAGGGLDTTARAFSRTVDQLNVIDFPVLVQNRPGGGQAVGLADYVTRFSKDDHRIFMTALPLTINYLREEGSSPFSYKDLTPIAQINADYSILAVNKESEITSLDELIIEMQDNPEDISIGGGSSPGSQDHLNVMMVALDQDIPESDVRYVSFDGSGEAMTSLLGNNIDVISTHLSGASQYIRSGDIRVLGISADKRVEGEFSHLPTYEEQGIDVVYNLYRGVFASDDVPKYQLEYWDNFFGNVILSDEWQEELDRNAWQPGYKDSKEFQVFLEEQEVIIKDILEELDMLRGDLE
ncbi:tripartite tricarboxylate transporter substrate binding protein [Geomicrobium sp. JCM 19055]|uniref:tripartite tricarboxylate transporter substrate binding protein n=1 Tax=Geomicrobium sp. JCM 19055 TaxID=1460649 RepID=UPI00045EDC8E|nr:tripartite tricarboxylate transporter substrate-binding protein [Geomicrobium sp. JCM 19055]GAK01591.1 tricarboxylate transport protein TctC [Geomicrobium sp. JCM 19055]